MKYISVIATLLLIPSLSPAFDTPNSGDSSLILHIWTDMSHSGTDAPASSGDAYGGYVIDTGLNFSDVVTDLSSAADITVDLDTIMVNGSSNTSLADAFNSLSVTGNGASNGGYFSLVAMDGQTAGGAITGDRAILTTISGTTPANGTNVQLNNAVGNAETYFGFISETDGVEYNTAAGGTVANGTAHALSDYWGNNFGGAWSAMDNDGSIDTGVSSTYNETFDVTAFDFSSASQSFNMALYTTGGSGTNGEAITNHYSDLGATLGQATLDFAAGTLTITPTQVPVPAAVWLFGSAILGLVGFSRRTSEQVSA